MLRISQDGELADDYRFAELTEPEMLLRLPEVGVVVVVVGVLMESRSASVYVVRVAQEDTLYTFRPPCHYIRVSLFAHLLTQRRKCKSNYCTLYAMLQTGCVKKFENLKK